MTLFLVYTLIGVIFIVAETLYALVYEPELANLIAQAIEDYELWAYITMLILIIPAAWLWPIDVLVKLFGVIIYFIKRLSQQ